MRFAERRLKYCVRRPIKNGIGAAAEHDDLSWPRYVRITDIAGPRALRDDTFMSLPPEQAAEAPFDVGDILAAAVGATFGKTYLHTQDLGPVAYAGYLVRISPSADFDSRFVAYWSESKHYWDQINTSVVQSTIQNFSATRYAELRLPVPHQRLQRAIADYLDRETARIDALIAAKKRVLGLLAEKRRALITRAVTRGLDPRAPLRDSGIPWLGEIPAHWELKRLKHVGRAIIGLTFDPANEVTDGSGVLVLRASNVRDQRIVLDDNVYVSMEIPEELRTREGDILICSRSGSRALIGKNALIDGATAGLTFGAFMTVFRSPYNDFLFYVFNSPLFDYQAGAFSTSTINQLTVETLNGMEVPLPPRPERERIVKRLREGLSQLDSVSVAIAQTIALLKERRSALIAAAVTGQIDVEAAA